jgi:hypothetical protein
MIEMICKTSKMDLACFLDTTYCKTSGVDVTQTRIGQKRQYVGNPKCRTHTN